ncbi:TetR/AcrR family transcriptional regulator [Halalkalibaculum sp. DA3122]|uniref:TetR/AcrR family transcriptional regulator n=1 Tax=unclassified Halalkalibaculum TaxID=2964617 RepID=UPI00375417E3
MSPRTPEQNEEIREQTRNQIKEAAFQLFAKEGFSNTSVRRVAEKAAVSKGLIYHYFSSKEEILVSIFEDLQEMGKEATTFPDGCSPAECLELMLEKVFGYIEESSEIMRLMISLALQPDAVAKLQPHIQKENERQVRLLSELLEKLGYDDPEDEAYYLAAKLDGVALGCITMGKEYPYTTIKQKILDEYVHPKEDR